ncbi:MAG: hypothetical protein HQL87_12465 [Magnetococcales bacterium]|nr:hypothetical protein [Magnetococcales bacterium]
MAGLNSLAIKIEADIGKFLVNLLKAKMSAKDTALSIGQDFVESMSTVDKATALLSAGLSVGKFALDVKKAQDSTAILKGMADSSKTALDAMASKNATPSESNFGLAEKAAASAAEVMNSSFTTALNLAEKAVIALGLAFTVERFLSGIHGATDAAAALQALSVRTGESVDELSQFSKAAKLSGASIDDVGTGLAALRVAQQGAADGNANLTRLFDGFNIKATDSAGKLRNTGDVLVDVSKKMTLISNVTDKAAFSQLFLKDAGTRLLPFMAEVSRAGELHTEVSQKQAFQASELARNLAELEYKNRDLYQTISAGVTPALVDFTAVLVTSNGLVRTISDSARMLLDDGSIKLWADKTVDVLVMVIDMANLTIDVLKLVMDTLVQLVHFAVNIFTSLDVVWKAFVQDLNDNPPDMAKTKDAFKKIKDQFLETEQGRMIADAVTSALDRLGIAIKNPQNALESLIMTIRDFIRTTRETALATNLANEGFNAYDTVVRSLEKALEKTPSFGGSELEKSLESTTNQIAAMRQRTGAMAQLIAERREQVKNQEQLDKEEAAKKKQTDAQANAPGMQSLIHPPEPVKVTKPADQFSEFRAELDRQKVATGDFFGEMLQMELNFWTEKRQIAGLSQRDVSAIDHEIYRIRKQQAHDSLNEQLESLRIEHDKAMEGGQKRIDIAKEMEQKISNAYGEGSKEQIRAHRAVEDEEQKHNAKMREFADLRIQSEKALAGNQIEMKQENLRFAQEMEILSARDVMIAKQALDEQSFQNTMSALQRELDLRKEMDARKGEMSTEQVKAQQALDNAMLAHNLQIQKSNHDLALETKRQFNTMVAPINTAISSSLSGLVTHQTTVQQATNTLLRAELDQFTQFLAKKFTLWVNNEMAETAMGQLFGMKRIGAQVAESTTVNAAKTTEGVVATETEGTKQVVAEEGLLAQAGGAVKSVMMSAWEGMANAYAAISAIPVVGPFMAPVVAAGVFAGIALLAKNILSAAGGFDVPAGINPVTQLHEREMVLPKAQAEVIRSLAANGTGGGAITIHVSAIDTKGFESWIHANAHTLAPALRKLARNAVPMTR